MITVKVGEVELFNDDFMKLVSQTSLEREVNTVLTVTVTALEAKVKTTITKVRRLDFRVVVRQVIGRWMSKRELKLCTAKGRQGGESKRMREKKSLK